MAEKLYEGAPDRVIINTGPSAGQALKLVLLGAALGYGAAIYGQKKTASSRAALARRAAGKAAGKAAQAREKFDSAADRLEDTIEDAGDSVEERLKSLAERIRDVSLRAKAVLDVAGETVRPVFDQAVEEGKRAAAEVQSKLKHDLDDAGGKPALIEEDEFGKTR